VSAPGNPVVSVVIGSYNRSRYLRATVDTVRHELADLPHEIVVVDGGSSDGSLRWLLRQKDVITIVQHNHGEWNGKPIERSSWGYFMNLAFRAASGKYICMLSDDCLVIPGAIVNGLDVFERALEAGEPPSKRSDSSTRRVTSSTTPTATSAFASIRPATAALTRRARS
jgi:glycosyltransferase involved in cell wall biosynthesis